MRILKTKGFSGIDENDTLSDGFTSALEMRNYRINDDGSLESIGGIETICTLESNIKAMWSGYLGYENVLIFISGGKVYRMSLPLKTKIPSYMDDIEDAEQYLLFYFNGFLYIMTDQHYYKFDGSALYEVEGYAPLIAISCKPSGEGEVFEQLNLITPKRRQLFSSDGTSKEYFLAEEDVESVLWVKIDGMYTVNYTFGENKRSIVFSKIPEAGINNVEILYTKPFQNSDKRRIFGCKKAIVFGGNSNGRVFLWGNKYYKNYRFHSEVANGVPSVEYFPVNAFTIIGNTKINSIVQQYNRQLIFCEKEAYYSYCELREDELGNVISSFPVFSLNASKGSLLECDGCIIENRPITLCEDGLNMWESTSVQDEKNAICFSNPISKTIKTYIELDPTKFQIFDFQANKELFIVYYANTFVYNYGNKSWYMYDALSISQKTVFGTKLFYSFKNTLYVFGNDIPNTNKDCGWASNYFTLGQSSGRHDILSCEVDVYIEGPVTLTFKFSESGASLPLERIYKFDESTHRHCRISFRPSIKRAMPTKIIITQSGSGKAVIHGIALKTKQRKRSLKHGLQ